MSLSHSQCISLNEEDIDILRRLSHIRTVSVGQDTSTRASLHLKLQHQFSVYTIKQERALHFYLAVETFYTDYIYTLSVHVFNGE